MLKRYLVFGGEHCYPNGGFGDLITSFDNKEEAMNEVENNLRNEELDDDNDWKWFSWGQVVDKNTGDVWHYQKYKSENKNIWTDGVDKIWG